MHGERADRRYRVQPRPADGGLARRYRGCEEADRFFGTDGSTFSLKITKLRNETREEAAGRDAPGVPSDGTDGTGDVMLTL